MAAVEEILLAGSFLKLDFVEIALEFDGPVVETLRDLHAHWNGGDGGFSAEEMLLTARIVAVANNFVALVSPRAYRAGLSFDAALDILHDKIGASDTRR